MDKKHFFAETICYEVVEVYTNDINDVYLVLFYDYSLKNAIKFLENQKKINSNKHYEIIALKYIDRFLCQ